MNVWHVITSEYPPDVGGVSGYTSLVAGALVRSGDEVHVWCPDGPRVAEADVHLHPELGSIGPRDLQRVGRMLDMFPGPRRLFVQWVPHGFGYHSMNLWFCLWLVRRACAGDRVELMVHEPYSEFRRGPLSHVVMAVVHRVMTLVILAAASRAWVSIPAWERSLRPYLLGRDLPMKWLPVPGCAALGDPEATVLVRRRYASAGQALIGHFGSHGATVSSLLADRLPRIMDGAHSPAVLLIGAGSDAARRAILEGHPGWADRVHAAGYVDDGSLGSYLAACDLFVQPYTDGVSSRRTSAMACLSQGCALVTTRGHLTEPLWEESRAVSLADVADTGAFADAVNRLLADGGERARLGSLGQRLYASQFSIDRLVATLRAA